MAPLDDETDINWEGEFKVAFLPSIASQALQGDKIILPHSALEQLLAASPFRPGTSSHDITSRNLPSPLMFCLSIANGNMAYAGIQEFSGKDGEVVISRYLAGVLGLRLHNDDNGDREKSENWNAPTIKIQSRQLPKGKYVRFRPLEAGYNPDDWRALLERQLKSFTTLTKDSILQVQGVKGEIFRLLADKFVPEGLGICVVDTDAEVDIEPLSEDQARETLRQVTSKKAGKTSGQSSEDRKIDIWKTVKGKVVGGSYVNYELSSWVKAETLNIILECEGDGHDVDLLASPYSSRQRAKPTTEEHIWSDMSSHKIKVISIQPTNVELEGVESIYISVHGYVAAGSHDITNSTNDNNKAPQCYKIWVHSGDLPNDVVSVRKPYDPNKQEHDPTDKLCSNCKRWIPQSAANMHSMFCERNNEVCSQCLKIFKRGDSARLAHWHCDMGSDKDDQSCAFGDTTASFEKHHAVFHNAIYACLNPACAAAGVSGLTLPQFSSHRTSTCAGKLILCQFCHLEVPQEGEGDELITPSAEILLTGLSPHEVTEGNRTTDCELCNRIVRLRELAAHVRNHDIERESRQKPTICRNALCGRTLYGVVQFGAGGGRAESGPGNDLGLCSLCFGPLYVPTHDPDGKALRRRVERRYLTQLMTGCGKAWCSNEWCRTGRQNLALEAKPTGAAAILKEIKPLVADAAMPQGIEKHHMWFCTDEGNQKSRVAAESIAADKGWDVEWAVAACEAEKRDVTRAREWLVKNAPTRKP